MNQSAAIELGLGFHVPPGTGGGCVYSGPFVSLNILTPLMG